MEKENQKNVERPSIIPIEFEYGDFQGPFEPRWNAIPARIMGDVVYTTKNSTLPLTFLAILALILCGNRYIYFDK